MHNFASKMGVILFVIDVALREIYVSIAIVTVYLTSSELVLNYNYYCWLFCIAKVSIDHVLLKTFRLGVL